MSLRIRRGTNAQRTGGILDQGEIGYTTDTKKLYIGDGVTYGGTNVVAGCAGTGLIWNETTQTLNATGGGGSSLPVNAVGVLKNNGSGLLSWSPVFPATAAGILTNNGSGVLAWTSATSLIQISNDDAPTLGGDLNINGFDLYNGHDIAVNGTISNDMISIIDSSISSLQTINISVSSPKKITFTGLSGGPNFGTSPYLLFSTSNGSETVPTNSLPGDCLASLLFRGTCLETTGYTYAGGLSVALSASADITQSYADTTISIMTGNNNSPIPNQFTFNHAGVFSAPILKTASYATGSLPLTPEAGWIVYDSTTNQFKGYVEGTTNDWVVLG